MKIQNHFKVCLYFIHIFNNRCIIISQYLLFGYLGSKALILLWPGRLILGLICFSAKSQAPAGTFCMGTLGKNWRCNLEGIGKEFSGEQRRHTQFISRFFQRVGGEIQDGWQRGETGGIRDPRSETMSFLFPTFCLQPAFLRVGLVSSPKGGLDRIPARAA